MAPSVLNLKKEKKYLRVKNKIQEYQKFIKKNFQYVGENFAYEARSIHYENKDKTKNIYGKATLKEVSELQEEGITGINVIPWIKETEN